MRRQSALTLGILLALVQTGGASAHSLVQLQRTLDTPSGWTLLARAPYRTSGAFSNYDDSDIPQIWHFQVRYAGCGRTRAGTLRLTVYRIPGTANDVPEFVRHVPHEAVRYSQSVVTRNAAGASVYGFLAAPKSTYLYTVDVLSRHSCTWAIAGEGT